MNYNVLFLENHENDIRLTLLVAQDVTATLLIKNIAVSQLTF